MKKTFKNLLVVLMAAMALGAFAACGGNDNDGLTINEGVLTIASSPNFPPFGYIADGGGYAGVDIQLATMIAEELGLELRVESMPFASVLMATQTGYSDVAISSMTINDARRQNMNFSTPYLISGQVIITLSGNDSLVGKDADEIIEYLRTARMGAGTPANTGAIFAADVIGANVTNFPSTALMVAGIAQGAEGVEYGILDHSVAFTMISDHPTLQVIDVPLTREYYGIGVTLGNYELLEKINEALDVIISDGRLDAILAQYGLYMNMGR
ncbi:MAG: transporter substrate-binding domain-containing protein [Defluviitaleaceae bacterium]|nr:transporter substrate-binding domain-containing protein [Defluviitaleaceae bacterium]